MKKIILMFAICGTFVTMQAQADKKSDENKMNKTGMSSTTYTQTPEEKTSVTVPEKIQNAFNEAYSSVKATWKKQGENFRAMFKSNEAEPLETIVVYDKNANVILTEKELKREDAPSEITKYCDDHLLNGSSCRVWQVDSKNGTRKYFLKHTGETVWFDSKGKHMTGAGTHMVHHKSTMSSKPYNK